jgi:hypothetical protein
MADILLSEGLIGRHVKLHDYTSLEDTKSYEAV